LAQATPSRNTEPNAHVAAVIQAYLPLSAFLGAPQADTNPVDVKALLKAANELASDEDAALKQAGQGLVAAVKAVDGQPIDQQRAKFKNLSKQVVALSKTQILAPSLGKLYAFRCTMDNSEWLQTTASPANPFFPVEMKTCGEVTQAITPKPATQPEVGK